MRRLKPHRPGIAHRLSCLRALIRPTVRALRLGPPAVGAGLGLIIVAVPAAMTVTLRPDDLTTLLRLGALCAAVGVTFVLDDPAKPSLTTVPVPGWLTAAVRVAAAVTVAGGWWAAAVAACLAGAQEGARAGVPVGGLTLEVATVVTIALCCAMLGCRRSPRGIGSIVAAPAFLLVVVILALLPQRIALLVHAGDPRWGASHHRWAALLLAAIAVLVAAATPPRAARLAGGSAARTPAPT
jgi:hypothetical protein